MDTTACRDHPEVAATGACHRCGRLLCEVCAFDLAGRRFCPDCVMVGPSVDERLKVLSGGLLSLGLAVLGFVGVVAIMVAGAAGVLIEGAVDQIVTSAMVVAGAGGLAAGLSSREGARRTGSVLPIIGIVGNALLIAILLVFIFIAMSR